MIRSTSSPSSSASSSSTSIANSPGSFSALGFTSTSESIPSSSSSSTSSAVTEKLASISSSSPYSSPRRTFSLPSKIKLPFSSSSPRLTSSPMLGGLGSPMIPLHSPTRSTARRVSYNIKSRASHYALPLSIGGFFTLAVFIYMSLNKSNEVSQFNNASKLSLYGRSRFSQEEHAIKLKQHQQYDQEYEREHEYSHGVQHHIPDSERDNGVSLLLMDEEELIAEDDLFWDTYKDPEPLSIEEQKLQDELKAHKQDVINQDKLQSLRALIWWLAEGGILPNNWEVPTKAYLKKIGGRGMERLLEDIDSGEEGDEIFDNGWAEFANRRYRVVIFSKTHCPYSRKAKSIFGEYHISPAPFIIELDQRSDMEKIQTLLQRLTGRRTVPNVLLDFVSIGGSDDVTLIHSEGGLQRRLEDMEVLPFSRRRRPTVPAPPPPVEPVAVVEPEIINVNVQEREIEQPSEDELVINGNFYEEESTASQDVPSEFLNTVQAQSTEIEGESMKTDTDEDQGDFMKNVKRDFSPMIQRKETNAEKLQKRQTPGISTLDMISRDQTGSWKEGGILAA
ncbi:glutaredoxin [Kwoniella shivajii]|uniref:Glutaredoxin n=1 Tax=Kwoniella shivajii TaxID=564305 RepID=A0ABZ1D093_9TREE|nr:glutaredoxin [Kwoniella shivajii]